MFGLSDCCQAPITLRKGKDENGEAREETICSRCHHVVTTDKEKANIINHKSDKYLKSRR